MSASKLEGTALKPIMTSSLWAGASALFSAGAALLEGWVFASPVEGAALFSQAASANMVVMASRNARMLFRDFFNLTLPLSF